MTLAPDRFEKPQNIGGGAAPAEEPLPDFPTVQGRETGQTMLFGVPVEGEPDDELDFRVTVVLDARVKGHRTDDEPDITVSESRVYRAGEARQILAISPDGPLDAKTNKPTPFVSLFAAVIATRNSILSRWDQVHADLSAPLIEPDFSGIDHGGEHDDWKVKPED